MHMKAAIFALACFQPLVGRASALHGLKKRLKAHNKLPVAASPDAHPVADDADTSIDWGEVWDGPIQHSGFLTFTGDREDASQPEINTFFWYLPALNGDEEAPLLIWLQGGPGGSSLYGMFEEIGPMGVDANMTLYPRDPDNNWNQKYSLLFLDNPCGVGFSWSSSESCFVQDEQTVGSDLRNAMLQFYKMFPNLKQNDLYITGESYAGKYVPAFSYTIFSANQNLQPTDDEYINFKGLSVGDGAMSPENQFFGFGDLLYNVAMINSRERQVFDDYETKR